MIKPFFGFFYLFFCGFVALAQDSDPQSVLKDIANRGTVTAKTTKGITSLRHQRARKLHAKHAEYLAGLAEGNTRAFPDIVDNWKAYQQQTEKAESLYQAFLSTKDKEQSEGLRQSLLKLLQPIGLVLKDASSGVVPEVVMSDELVAEQEALMNEFNELPTAVDANNVKLMSPDVVYTLKHLPILIQFTGPKDSVIMLQSEVGGSFPNGLDYFKLKTDGNGLASTYWMSNGDGVAECQILYRSPELITKGRITAIVRQLNLVSLESFSPVARTAINQADSVK